MVANISIPKSKEEMTTGWFNSIFNPVEGIVLASMAWLGPANNGRGALSALERVKLTLQDNREMYVIIKSLPLEANLRAYVSSSGYSSREVNMYVRVFRDIDNFLNERNVGDECRFRRPKCYFGAEETNENGEYNMIMVLEDMIDSHFSLWDEGPYEPLDWDRTVAALKQIAFLHAGSLAYRTVNKISDFWEVYPFLLSFRLPDPNVDSYLESGLDVMRKIFKDMEENGETVPSGLPELLESQKSKIMDILFHFLIPIPGKVSTICHNDLHTHNICYYGEGESMQACWFDFQACFDGPPMKDVTFFLLNCCDFSFSSTRMSESLQVYHTAFSEALAKMQVDVAYPLEDMKRDFEKSLFVSLWHIIASSKFWCARPEFEQILKKMVIGVYEMGLLKSPLE